MFDTSSNSPHCSGQKWEYTAGTVLVVQNLRLGETVQGKSRCKTRAPRILLLQWSYSRYSQLLSSLALILIKHVKISQGPHYIHSFQGEVNHYQILCRYRVFQRDSLAKYNFSAGFIQRVRPCVSSWLLSLSTSKRQCVKPLAAIDPPTS